MKPEPKRHLLKIALAPLALMVLLLGGCFDSNRIEEIYAWPPDGKWASVVKRDQEEGLLLCDAEGNLSAPLVPGVTRVAWLSDSQRMVLARSHEESKWSPIARAMSQTRAEALVAQALATWQKLQTGSSWGGDTGVASLFAGRHFEWNLICIYLREHYGEILHSKLDADQWEEVAKRTVKIHRLVMARIESAGDKIAIGTQLYEGIDEISNVRVSPDDKAIAFVTLLEPENSSISRLWIVPVGASNAQLVAENVFGSDWTGDSRSLAYVQIPGMDFIDKLPLGVLVQREVLDADGKIQLQSNGKNLAFGLSLFSNLLWEGCSEGNAMPIRIRCLQDGRILFNAQELSLPATMDDGFDGRSQLFAFDPTRQATLVRLIPRSEQEKVPHSLAFFEVSPSEKQVLFGDCSGNVGVFTLSTGKVEQVQKGGEDTTGAVGAPVWRTEAEFAYTRRTPEKHGEKSARAGEVVLRRGTEETVLSRSWPDEMVNGLFK